MVVAWVTAATARQYWRLLRRRKHNSFKQQCSVYATIIYLRRGTIRSVFIDALGPQQQIFGAESLIFLHSSLSSLLSNYNSSCLCYSFWLRYGRVLLEAGVKLWCQGSIQSLLRERRVWPVVSGGEETFREWWSFASLKFFLLIKSLCKGFVAGTNWSPHEGCMCIETPGVWVYRWVKLRAPRSVCSQW